MAERPEINGTSPDEDTDIKRIIETDKMHDSTYRWNNMILTHGIHGEIAVLCEVKSELYNLFHQWEAGHYKTDSKKQFLEIISNNSPKSFAWVIMLKSNESEHQRLPTEMQNLSPMDLRQLTYKNRLAMMKNTGHNQLIIVTMPSNHDNCLNYDISPTKHVQRGIKRQSSFPAEQYSGFRSLSLSTDYNARYFSSLVIFISKFDLLKLVYKNVFTLYNEHQLYLQHINRQHNSVVEKRDYLKITPNVLVKIDPVELVIISNSVDIPQTLSFIDQSTQTIDNNVAFQDCYNRHHDQTKLENLNLLKENESLKRKLWEKSNLIEKYRAQFQIEKTNMHDEITFLEDEILNWKKKCQKIEKDMKTIERENKDLLFENGRLLIEIDSKITKEKDIEKFKKIYPSVSTVNGNKESAELRVNNDHNRTITQNLSGINHVGSNSTLINDGNASPEPPQFPVQVEERNDIEPIGERNDPSSATSPVNNAYKQLLLAVAHSLLFNDVIKLKDWAQEQFSVETNLIATEAMFQLDRKCVINPKNLSVLRVFFESILRYDLAHLIQQYCCGDYVSLRQEIVRIKERIIKNVREHNLHRVRSSTTFQTHSYSPRSSAQREVSQMSRQAVCKNAIVMSGSSNQHDTANGNLPNFPRNSTIDTWRNDGSSMFEDIADRRFRNKTRGMKETNIISIIYFLVKSSFYIQIC